MGAVKKKRPIAGAKQEARFKVEDADVLPPGARRETPLSGTSMQPPLLADSYNPSMYAPHCSAFLALLVILVALILYPKCRPKEGLGRRFHNNHLWPTTTYYWHRDQWPGWAPRGPGMRWWRYPGYAMPLELSLPLHNFQEYLYGYPPASRMPYNA
jgi:hypothetical protein